MKTILQFLNKIKKLKFQKINEEENLLNNLKPFLSIQIKCNKCLMRHLKFLKVQKTKGEENLLSHLKILLSTLIKYQKLAIMSQKSKEGEEKIDLRNMEIIWKWLKPFKYLKICKFMI